MIPLLPPWAIAAAVAGALIAGAASGALVAGWRWEAKWEKREREYLTARLEAETKAREMANEIRVAADRITSAPVRRVLCAPDAPAPDVPGGGADAGLGGARSVPADRDYGPALREAIALQARVIQYGLQTRNP